MAISTSTYVVCPFYHSSAKATINCENCESLKVTGVEKKVVMQAYCCSLDGMKLCDRYIRNIEIWEVAI